MTILHKGNYDEHADGVFIIFGFVYCVFGMFLFPESFSDRVTNRIANRERDREKAT